MGETTAVAHCPPDYLTGDNEMTSTAASEAGLAAPAAETALEDPNSRVVIAGQILCILVPLAVWFAPLGLEPVTQHALAIVGFMVVAWITRAMDYALAGLVGCFLFWALRIVAFPVAFSGFANDTAWFLFGALLLGTVGLFDLRVLGMAKAIPPSALHKLIPIGIAGYCVNILTGITFFSGFPEQYAYNPSFFWKGVFMAIAGMNVALFYLSSAFREVKTMPAGADAPFRAKVIAGTSLGAWVAVLICGRLLTFYRPLFFH
jgi:di/tricarboxylate transporter